MTVIRFEKNGVNGKERVKVLFVGKSLGREQGVIPSAAQNPWVFGMLLGVLLQEVLNFRDVVRACEIDASQA